MCSSPGINSVSIVFYRNFHIYGDEVVYKTQIRLKLED